MAYRTIGFEASEISDGNASDGVVVVGGLRFTVTAQGNWSLNFDNGRLNFSEDPAFASSEFKIEVTNVSGANFQYNDYIVSYQASTDWDGYLVLLDSRSTTIGDTDYNANYNYGGAWVNRLQSGFPGMTSGEISKITITDMSGSPSAPNPQSSFWIDQLVVDTDITPPPVAPVVTSISSSDANGGYKVGQTIHVTVSFDQAVDVDISGGSPALQLETGATDRKAIYSGGDGTNTLTFSYTVQAGDTSADLDYISTAALLLEGATITLAGTTANAILTLPSPGTAGSLGANKAIRIDGIAPTLIIHSDKPALKTGETATITFTFSEDPGASFSAADIVVSGGTLGPINGSGLTRTATFTPTADTNNGTASITVKAGLYTDAVGNSGGAGVTPSITFDTSAPVAPAAPDLSAASDSGSSSTDDITNASTLTFSGAAGSVEAGAVVRLYDTDGTTVIAITSAKGDGSWLATANALSEGAHTITARATDAAGNVSAASSGIAVTIDRAAPTTVAVSAALSDDTGVSSNDMVTSSASQTINGTISANLATGERIEVSLDNGATWDVATADGSNWSLAATLSGSGILQVRVVDAAGNAGGIYTKAYALDTIAPAAPSVPDLNAGSDTGSSNTDNITSDTTPTFSGTAENGATLILYDGAVAIGSTVVVGGVWSITSGVLTQGPHTITARATDAAGNVGPASTALAIQVITDAPATGVSGMTFSADTGASAFDFVTNTVAQTISGTLDAVLAVGERVEVSFDGGDHWVTASSGGNAWSLPATLATGTHTIAVRVVNAIDKGGPIFHQDYTLDTGAPDVTISSNVSQLKAGETATITFTFSEDPGASFTWDGSAGDVTVSGGTLSAISGTGLTRTAIFTPDSGVASGTAIIAVYAGAFADLAGNIGTAGAPPVLNYNTLEPGAPSVPVLAVGSDSGFSSNDNVTRVTSPTLTGTAEAGATVRLYDTDGALIGSGVATDGIWSITTSPLTEGSHRVTAKATNAAGNTSAASSELPVVVDMTALALVGSRPADDATNVVATANLVLTFSEAVHKGTGTIQLRASNGALVESFNVATSGRISIADNTLTLDPTSPLKSGAGYYLTMAASAITDAAGNGFAGLADNSGLKFTIAGPPGPVITPNQQGGHNITVVDSAQITAGLGTSGLDHVFYGGSGTITLPGNIENVTLTSGNASARGTNANNALAGSTGNNLLQGMSGNDQISGGGGNDRLYGDSGQDRLDGGAGNDWLDGGTSDDRAYGGAGDDRIYGGSGYDTIDGGSGNDRAYGGVGRDNVSGGAGNDIVGGDTGDDRLYGGSGNDQVYGGSGHDTLDGGLGNDVLFADAGKDTFVFSTALNARTNVDTIRDFAPSWDRIWLDDAVFRGLGSSSKARPLGADQFVLGSRAQDREDRIIYDQKSGALYYDADGTGAKAQVQFAVLSNKAKITYHDFYVI